MKDCCTKILWEGIIFFPLFICLFGCESATSYLTEVDENGEIQHNNGINISNALISTGVKGYAIDSLYTEFGFNKGKHARIASYKKGIVTYQDNGLVKDITWGNIHPEIRYSEVITYKYDSLSSKIAFNNNSFAEVIENYNKGKLESIARYRYFKSTGYLNYVILERAGKEPVTIYFKYPKDGDSGEYGDYPTVGGGIIIIEGDNHYKINLAIQKIENKGYVCNVLQYANAPLTNKYIINPDLYYMGVYGVPIKYLPDVLVMNSAVTEDDGTKVPVIKQVENCTFFYNK
ncbi:MAG: hypothetical protein LBH90_09570 [Tannerella sp.]|jgi:hypothetical protein|nr:hypothetical protein [Tannerella sp.]